MTVSRCCAPARVYRRVRFSTLAAGGAFGGDVGSEGRLELGQRSLQRIESRRAGKPVVLDDAPKRRGDSGPLVVVEANCRHGLPLRPA
jgi:hypothetical protein